MHGGDRMAILAKAAGVQVITTTSSKEEEAKDKVLVVHEVISYWEVPEWSKQVIEPRGGKGAEQVLKVGRQSTLMQYLNSVKWEAFVGVIGVIGQDSPEVKLCDQSFSPPYDSFAQMSEHWWEATRYASG
ncbi:Zinc-binding dehydrogenase [Rhizoctonia solani]|uniref:Zinc-binding dehydrogenase n=1 Tax=Rhizoctonia solani TaxID=456999 RepID=A0A8H7GZY7_9AGAM|nr:Zinc-binding dehydrogenase [Rhizoctonia solani]